ncbi:acyl-CoA N-acyltransferase [Thozetella sp. PMI_491]|nr:acyl-CoA N-acyltransferase [Thozetella sp. PMI_491]
MAASPRSWKIEPVVLADAEAVARNNVMAFWEDPSYTIVWKDIATLDHVIERSIKRTRLDFLEEQDRQRYEKAVDPVTGELVGYARWKFPIALKTTAEGDPLWPERQMAAASEEEYQRIKAIAESAGPTPKDIPMDDEVTVIKRRLQSQKSYMLLAYLAVHPENQNKGIATMLVQSGIDQCKRMGMDIFVQASPAGRGIYEKLGFRVLDSHSEDLAQWGGEGNYTVHFMAYDQDRNGSAQADATS